MSNTGSPDSRGASVYSQNSTSLPSRQKQNATVRVDQAAYKGGNHGIFAQPSTDATGNHSPGQDDNAMLTNFDMDVSPVVSNVDHMNSENASPETLNSSSNTAFTPPSMDQPSVGGQSQNIGSAKNAINPNLMDFNTSMNDLSNSGDISFSQFFDMNSMNVGMDPIGMENPLPLSGTWNPAAQPAGVGNGSFEMMDDTNNFSEPQFEILLQGMGWNGWPQPN